MKIIQTEKQLEFSHEPTKLEILREIHKRDGLNQHHKLKKEYNNLEKGFEGEERLVRFLETYGDPNWVALQNIWLDHYTEFECDLLLFTQPQIYAFEAKNYSGKWELKNGQCFRNGQKIGHNPFSQAQKSVTDLNGLLKEGGNPQKLQGVLSFTGIHNNVQLHDPIEGIDVRILNELQTYIWDITEEERKYRGYSVDVDSVLQTLTHYEIGKPTKEKEIPDAAKKNLRTGICCCHCGTFNLKRKNNYLICDCGMHEPWEEAIVRTICEYGVIHHDKELTTKELTDFFGEDAGRSTIYRYLKKHFESVGAKRGTYYLNKKLPFEKIKHGFKLKLPKYIKLK